MDTRTELQNEAGRIVRSRRARLRWLLGAIVVVLAGSGFVVWKATWHLMAASWLQSNNVKVDWQIDKETWKRGGVTTVKAVSNYSFFTTGGDRTEIQSLDRLHHVESLDLAQLVGLGDADVEVVGRLTDLTFLSLDQTGTRVQYQAEPRQLTDATLARLANLTRLKELYLGGHKFTDAGMIHLAGLADLEVLDLQGNPITDAGLDPLKRLTHLRQLTLIRTKVTPQGVKALEAALPNAMIHFEPTPASAP